MRPAGTSAALAKRAVAVKDVFGSPLCQNDAPPGVRSIRRCPMVAAC